MLHRSAQVLLVLALAASALALSACGSKPPASQNKSASLYSVVAAPLVQMTPAEKRSEIASSFPMQIPVPRGAIENAEAQGPSAWVYTMVVPGEPDRVARWYVDVYQGAEWSVAASDEGTLDLRKNRAQTRLQFEAVNATTPSTKVTASVGVGTDVLGVQ
jgi:hypothetical protein